MGTAGRQIVGKDADKIIAMLNKLYCDEWLEDMSMMVKRGMK
jgi:hypothetical protein